MVKIDRLKGDRRLRSDAQDKLFRPSQDNPVPLFPSPHGEPVPHLQDPVSRPRKNLSSLTRLQFDLFVQTSHTSLVPIYGHRLHVSGPPVLALFDRSVPLPDRSPVVCGDSGPREGHMSFWSRPRPGKDSPVETGRGSPEDHGVRNQNGRSRNK